VLGIGAHHDSGVLVRAEWTSATVSGASMGLVQTRTMRAETRADSAGRFRLCAMPLDTPLEVMAVVARGHVPPATVRLTPAQPYAVTSLAVDTLRIATSVVRGVVTDTTGRPLPLAEVTLGTPAEAVRARARTDSSGRFAFDEVPAGAFTLGVRRVGYGEVSTPITVAPPRREERRIVLSAVQTVAAVSVTATRRDPDLLEFEDRRRMGLGTFLTRETLERREGQSLASALARSTPLRLEQGSGSRVWIASSRSRDIPRILDPTDALLGAPPVCYAHVYVDGRVVFQGLDHEPLFDANSIRAEDIEAVEYYSGPADTPARFSRLNATCGVVVIWTRRR
jgi:hypothetical protein